MRWALNSSMPMPASELGEHLEAARLWYEKGLLKRFARNLLNDEEPSARGAVDDEVERQMKTAIRSACVLAESMGPPGSLFLATLSGHVDSDNPQGIKERMAVFVDLSPAQPRPAEDPTVAFPASAVDPPIGSFTESS